MDEARIDRAMSRIEAAVNRVEQAARSGPAGDDELALRHAALRQRVDGALKDLDTLIAGLER
jgi:hypothetical protein